MNMMNNLNFFKTSVVKILKLDLNPSEQVEIGQIDERIQKLPSEVCFLYLSEIKNDLVQHRKRTIQAYDLKNEMEIFLALAKIQPSVAAREQKLFEALYFAQEADELRLSLAQTKFKDQYGIKTIHYRDCVVYFWLQCLLNMYIINFWLFDLTKEEISITHERMVICTLIIFLPTYIRMWINNTVTDCKIIESILPSLEEDVLSVAKAMKVELDPTEALEKPPAYIPHLDKLAQIGSPEVPQAYLCSITWEIMDDPVYAEQHYARFEKKAILQSLRNRAIHPYTIQNLDSGDLKSDHLLKKEIALWANAQVLAYSEGEATLGEESGYGCPYTSVTHSKFN